MPRVPILEEFAHDLRYGWRVLRARPTPTLLAVTALTLGIGVGTAIFSIVNAVLIQPLPYRDPSRLVMLWNTNEHAGNTLKQQKTMGRSMSIAEAVDWRAQNDIFEGMVAFRSFLTRLGNTDDPEIVFGYSTSPGVFPLLGVKPLMGRAFEPADEKENSEPVVVLQHDFWKRRFHGNPNALGQRIFLDNRPHTIIGVMPPEFVFFNRQIDFLAPAQWNTEGSEKFRGRRNLRAMARLKSGVSLQEAQARADAFSATLARQYPESNQNWRMQVVPLSEDSAGDLRPAMLVLLCAVGCVLLITCANVTNLLLVQASARNKELALRGALGAGRFRLIRQLLTESLVLAVTGGVLGLGLAFAIVRYFQSVVPDRYTHGKYLLQIESIRVDPTVVAFAIAITVLSGLLFGLIPGWKASQPNFNQALKDVSRGSVGGRRGRIVRNTLVIVEVAMAVILVVGASLLVRSFVALYERGPGFRTGGLLTMEVAMEYENIENQVKQQKLSDADATKLYKAADLSFRQRLYTELSTVPAVDAVTATAVVPLSSYYNLSDIHIEGRTQEARTQAPQAIFNMVHPNYFEVLGMPLLRGRSFGSEDRPDSPLVMVITQEFARRYFSGEDPIGKRVRWAFAKDPEPWSTIVGVIGDVREDGMDRPPQPYMFQSESQHWFPGYLIIHTKNDPMSSLAAVQRAIKKADQRAAIYRVLRLEDIVRNSAWRLNYSMMLLGALAALALVLAVVGVYGVLSYSVRERTQEFGVRIALGAGTSDVLGLVIKQGLALVGIGIVIGLAISAVLTRFLQTLLFGVAPIDLTTFAGVAVALLLAGLGACYLPARRALRLDPIVALRYE